MSFSDRYHDSLYGQQTIRLITIEVTSVFHNSYSEWLWKIPKTTIQWYCTRDKETPVRALHHAFTPFVISVSPLSHVLTAENRRNARRVVIYGMGRLVWILIHEITDRLQTVAQRWKIGGIPDVFVTARSANVFICDTLYIVVAVGIHYASRYSRYKVLSSVRIYRWMKFQASCDPRPS